jgi:hypothetical protein
VALTVKLNVPARVGFPLMTALVADEAVIVRPGGRLPAVTAKLTVGPAAPALVAAMVAE